MLLKAASLISLGAGMSRLAMLGAVVIVARLIDIEDFGIWGFLQSTIILMTAVGSLGIGNIITIQIASINSEGERIESLRVAIYTGLILGLFGSFVLLVSSYPFALLGLNNAEKWNIFAISSPLLFLSILTNCQNSIFLGESKFTTASIVSASGGLLSAAGIVLGASQYALIGAIWGQIIGLTLQVVIGFLLSHSFRLVFSKTVSFLKIRNLIREGSPLAISGLFAFGTTWVCFAFATHRVNGIVEIALVNAALQWRNIIGFLPNQAISSSISLISKLHAAGNVKEVKRMCMMTLCYSYLFAIVFIIPIYIWPELALSLFGSKYQSNPEMIYLCCFLILLEVLNRCMGTFLNILGKAAKNIPMTIVFSVVSIFTALATSDFAPLTIILSLIAGMAASCIWAVPVLVKSFNKADD